MLPRLLSPVFLALLGLAGCIGTDYINDPLGESDARIEVTPLDAALRPDQMTRLQATYFDADGQTVPGTAFTWTSSDSQVASVDAEGEVTGLDLGVAMIQAAAEGVNSAPVLLRVVATSDEVARVIVSPDTVRIMPGEEIRFEATALNVDGDTLARSGFSWSSSDETVATVTEDGSAMALEAGVAGIRASTDGVESVPALLQVTGQQRSGMFGRYQLVRR